MAKCLSHPCSTFLCYSGNFKSFSKFSPTLVGSVYTVGFGPERKVSLKRNFRWHFHHLFLFKQVIKKSGNGDVESINPNPSVFMETNAGHYSFSQPFQSDLHYPTEGTRNCVGFVLVKGTKIVYWNEFVFLEIIVWIFVLCFQENKNIFPVISVISVIRFPHKYLSAQLIIYFEPSQKKQQFRAFWCLMTDKKNCSF